MELPSPLVEKFLPDRIVRGFSDSVIKKENNRLNLLCFHSALWNYFNHKLYSNHDGRMQDLRMQISRLFVNGAGKFDKLHVVTRPSTGVDVHCVSDEAHALMMNIGSNCCAKALYPFSVHGKPKDPAFIVSVASSFEYVFDKLYPLWVQFDPSVGPRLHTTGVIMREIILAHEDSRDEECLSHAKLALEAWCLETFNAEYFSLTDAQKANPDNAVTRAMFWCASFFYGMLNPKWDKDNVGDIRSWIDASLDAYLEETNTGFRPTFYSAVCDTRGRINSKYDALEQMRRFVRGLSPADAAELNGFFDLISSFRSEYFYLSRGEELDIKIGVANGLRVCMSILSENVRIDSQSATDGPVDARSSSAGSTTPEIVSNIDIAIQSMSSPMAAELNRNALDSLVQGRDVCTNMGRVYEVERDDDDDDDDTAARHTRLNRNQRRRNARERQIAEATQQMKDLLDKVTQTAGVLNAQLDVWKAECHEGWLEKKFQTMIWVADHFIDRAVKKEVQRRAVDAAVEQCRLEAQRALASALEQRRVQEERTLAEALSQRSADHDRTLAIIREEWRREREFAVRRAEEAAQAQARAQVEAAQAQTGAQVEAVRTEMADRGRDLALSILEAGECFICLNPLDLLGQDVLFLTCCVGGSFACPGCIGRHDRHPVQGIPLARRLMDCMRP